MRKINIAPVLAFGFGGWRLHINDDGKERLVYQVLIAFILLTIYKQDDVEVV